MNVIFTDVDGVLNYKNFDEEYFCEFLENQSNSRINVDPYKVSILARICRETDSKLVLSSSWKLLNDAQGKHKEKLEELLNLFNRFGIEFYGYTPNIPNLNARKGEKMWKEYDIQAYLKQHPEVTSFCIFDDELYDLTSMKDYLIQTYWDVDGMGDGGILDSHIEDASRILKQTQNKNYSF